jgi:hypothetical protein
LRRCNLDEIVKSQKIDLSVIPAEAGIQYFQHILDSGFHRSDDGWTFYESINLNEPNPAPIHQEHEKCRALGKSPIHNGQKLCISCVLNLVKAGLRDVCGSGLLSAVAQKSRMGLYSLREMFALFLKFQGDD